MMNYVLIIGAKSDIAKAIAKEYAKNGYNLYLAGRNIIELEDFSSDLSIRYNINSHCYELDILDYATHNSFYNDLPEEPIGVISAVGYLGNQIEGQNNFAETLKIINTNYTGVVSLLAIAGNNFQRSKQGFIIGISSVAGDRGKKSNYIYGSSKAALTAYLSGLRNQLHESNIQVITVKPGFVYTKMTQGFELNPYLTAQPEQVAKAVFKAQQKGTNILYTKNIWRLIMFFIQRIPESLFKRMNL